MRCYEIDHSGPLNPPFFVGLDLNLHVFAFFCLLAIIIIPFPYKALGIVCLNDSLPFVSILFDLKSFQSFVGE